MLALIAFVLLQVTPPQGVVATPRPGIVAGTVVDIAGDAVAGALIVVRPAGGADVRATSGADGRFTLDIGNAASALLVVSAPGLMEARRTLAPGEAWADVRVVLAARVSETVTVTATRGERLTRDVPASVSVMGRAEIERTPAVVSDDLLRRMPAFSLFRRTSSLSSHPTAQGVSLRGIGPSGVSRTLVLLDGVPFNDPFGGWVYWTRVPLDNADRIEVVDGSSSSLYGNYAMGGVINIVSRPALPRSLELRTQYGNHDSPKLDVRASHTWGRFGATASVSTFDTDGFAVVAPDERGLVDTKAAVTFTNANLRLTYDASDRVQAFVQGGYFRENRDNAKVTTTDGTPESNSTRWRSFSAGVRAGLDGGHNIDARLFVDAERFRSNFMAVPAATPARSVGRMTLLQTVPTTGVGASVQWSRAFGARHALSAGLDWRRVTGESQEQSLDPQVGATVTMERFSGGRQNSTGVFVQDVIAVTDALTVTASARLDHWSNADGHNIETLRPSGLPAPGHAATLPDRSDIVGSPRIGVLYHLTDRVSVWGSAGAGFRAPTLNELYRQFRVGTTLTQANYDLGPERLIGTEAGVRFTPATAVNARLTWFDNRVTDPVSNVTIATAGSMVTQQRQNLGRTRIHGLQGDVDYAPSAAWRLSAGYLYSHATIVEFAANPEIEGNFLPQVPRHRGSVSIAYMNPRWADLTLDIQAVGSQFDDDRNSRIVPGYDSPGLPKYAVVSLYASRRISDALDVFVGAQNLFDQVYYVGTLPTTIGTPRLVNVGLRVRVGGR